MTHHWQQVDKPNNLRITLFIPTLTGGGAEHIMLTLAKFFVRQGYQTDLLLLRAEGELLNQIDSNINFVILDKQKTWLAIPSLIMWLRANRPQVLISSLSHLYWGACLAVRLSKTNTRCICREASVLSKTLSSASFLDRHLLLLLLRRVCKHAHFITLSQEAAYDLIRTLGLNETSITVIANPVIDENFHKKSKEHIDHPWLNSKNIPVILAVGRLHKVKGFDVLLSAFAELVTYMNVRLLILGEGPERPALETKIRELNIENSVSMPGFVNNPIAYMTKADILVLSSRWEGLSNVLIEAMSCGIPIVSTDCPGGPREILDNGRYGRLVPVEDHTALAQGILEVLKEDRKQQVPKYWMDQFLVKTAATKYIELIDVILRNESNH